MSTGSLSAVVMSRRATPSQAAQNQQTIKNLLKLDYNKTCADCKRNKRGSLPSPSPEVPCSHRLGRITIAVHVHFLGFRENDN